MLFGHHPKKKRKKTKKELQLEKNKRDTLIFQMSALSRGDQPDEGLGMPEYVRPREKLKRKDDQSQKLWSAKVQEIKDRNSGKKRAALDRFNRFAGTSDAGGRGR